MQVMTGEAALAVADHQVDDPSVRLGDLFDAHHLRLYRLARRLSPDGDTARDVVQETFLRVARVPHRVPAGRQAEEAWLVRVLVNVCRDRWRQASVRGRGLDAELLQPTAPSDPEAAAAAKSVVWRALGALPPRRRAVIVMHELEGTDVAAIARLLGVSLVTVRWHLSRGRLQLAAAVRDLERRR
jgi:RNA polymerase sigma factor (sigma-70 family)